MARKIKYLTLEEIKYLQLQLHESQENIEQIDEFYPHIKITIDGKRSTMAKAKSLLSKEAFLGSLDRATFHYSTSNEGKNGSSISFDASDYWYKLTRKDADLQKLYNKYEQDPDQITTNELVKLAKEKWITNQDLWANLQWDAGIGEDEETIEDQAKKSDEIHFDSTLYGFSERDGQSPNFMYDEYIWLDCIPTKYNKQSQEFEFDVSKLSKKSKELFYYAQDMFEYHLKNNLKNNFSFLFNKKKIGK